MIINRGGRDDHHIINQASGNKTDSTFQRYNLVTEEDDERDAMAGRKGRKFRNDGHQYGHQNRLN